MLSDIYPETYASSSASQNVTSIAFVGTVLGQLIFGVTSDYWSRKWSLFIATCILIVFGALCAGSYGAHDSQYGLFDALTAYRFFLGIGLGGEYPAGSVAAAESTGELKSGHRNRWFIFFTDFMIDAGYVVSAIVATVVVVATTERHLRAAWRICLGIGIIPPLSLLWLRYKLNEPEEFNRERMNKYPYWLILKYVLRLTFFFKKYIYIYITKMVIGSTGSDWFVLSRPKMYCIVKFN
jgi:MFS family permease